MEWNSEGIFYELQLRLRGNHQWKNASVALMALHVLSLSGYDIDFKNAVRFMELLRLPGRFEQVSKEPFIILDAAHNPDGIQAFIETVNLHYPNSEKHVIVAMFQDKETDEMLRLLSEQFTHMTLTSFPHPRAWHPEIPDDLETGVSVDIDPDYTNVLRLIDSDDRLHFITGSLHFITVVRDYYTKKGKNL